MVLGKGQEAIFVIVIPKDRTTHQNTGDGFNQITENNRKHAEVTWKTRKGKNHGEGEKFHYVNGDYM